MDLSLFRALNGLAGHGALWDGIIVFFASYLQYALAAVLLVVSLGTKRRHLQLAAGVVAGVVAGLAVKPLLLLFIHRARPFVALSGVHHLVSVRVGENLHSFPSGHASVFFALAMVMYRFNRRLGCVFFAGAILMGISRVIGGVHWPVDIVVGAVIGILAGWNTVQWIRPFRKSLSSS